MSEKRDITIDNKFGRHVVKVEVKKKRRPVYRPTQPQVPQQDLEADLQKKQEAIRKSEEAAQVAPQASVTQDLELQKKRAFFFGDRKLLHSIHMQKKTAEVKKRPPFNPIKRPPSQTQPRPPFKRTLPRPPIAGDFKAKYNPLPKPQLPVRKQVAKPAPRVPFTGNVRAKSKISSHMPPLQLGRTLLGKIESADDVAIENERLRSIAAVRRSREKQKRSGSVDTVVREITVFNDMPVVVLAHSMAVSVTIVLAKLRELNINLGKNDRLDIDTSCLLVEEFGHKYKKRVEILDTIQTDEGSSTDYVPRAPIVTVVGHVDHGKTSLLDALRATQFTSMESGGITQSIGASQVFTDDGRFVTFIDTPGHKIFTEMRARGINITDIVLLIIAADDGIKEQTVESIQHAQAANANLVVVITKADKPSTNIDKIKQMLMQYNIVVESLGGDVPDIDVSAKTGHNLKELLEIILFQAELLDLRANPNPKASGVVLEAYLDKNCGPVATVIIKNGTLRRSNPFLSGTSHGKVRSITDWKGKTLTEAGPSVPVQIMGFDKIPSAGDDFIVMDEADAKEASAKRQELSTMSAFSIHKSEMTYTIDDIWQELLGDGDIMKMNFIIKADSSGSCEAIAAAIGNINHENVRITTILKGIGSVTDSDILLAKASDASIIAFKVDSKPSIVKNAETWGVKIKRYDVIYQILDDINDTITKALAPKEEEVSIGRAEVREVFTKHKIGTIAGCFVQDGVIKRDAKAVLIRNGIQVYSSIIESIRHLRDDRREMKAGQECGIMLSKFADYRPGDVIECFEMRPL